LAKLERLLDDDEDSMEDQKDIALLVVTKNVQDQRYIFRASKYRKGTDRFKADLPSTNNDDDDEDDVSEDDQLSIASEASTLPWLTEEEFISKYRCTRSGFSRILGDIKDHSVFKTKTTKCRQQAPVVHQLMVFMKFLGTEGTGGSNTNQRQMFSIGYGTAELYRRRVTRAIMSLRDKYIKWPDAEERKQIALQIHEEFKFPHCVGIVDGTLFPLAFEPTTEDAPDYSGRKFKYSLTTTIVCNNQ
jgi:hypothetical protein